SRSRHTRFSRDWSSDVCSSDLADSFAPLSDPLLRFTDVDLGYGDFTVLKGISMQVLRGQVVAMMGGSGSGKTTLLRAATGQILRSEERRVGKRCGTRLRPRP